MKRTAFAPAKVNLSLHVGALQSDGYHPLESLMVFADIGDRVSFVAADGLGLEVTGEFGAGLAATPSQDNLVLRAVGALFARVQAPPGVHLTLAKNLPIAAGLGRGSSDAGAALRAVRDGLALDVDDDALLKIASSLGADGAACLAGRPVLAQGRGERIRPVELPILHAVLVNPRTPCATAAVYRAYDAERPAETPDGPAPPTRFAHAGVLIDYLRTCRNDLERPAATVAPAIDEVLARVRGRPEARLARLSGSGATVFALCDDAASAGTLRDAIGRARPDWWRVACRLGGPWSLDDASQAVSR